MAKKSKSKATKREIKAPAAITEEKEEQAPFQDARFQWFRWLFLILVIAFILRIGFLTEVSSSPFATPRLFDQANYIEWAEGITKGQWEGMNKPYWQGPLYPYTLATVFTLFGKGVLAIRFLQLFLGLAIVAGVFFLTRILFDDLAALIAALIAAVFRTFIFMESAVLAETMLAFFNLIAIFAILYAWRKQKIYWWLLAGLLIGIASVGRGTALMIIPLVLFWLFFLGKRQSFEEAETATSRSNPPAKKLRSNPKAAMGKRLLPIAVFILGVVIAIAPVTIRNKAVSKEFVLLSANAGLNLFIGNHQGANGTYDLVPGLDTQSDPRGEAYAKAQLRKEVSSTELSKFYTGKVKEFTLGHPKEFIRLLGKKLLLFMHAAEIPHDDDFEYFRRKSVMMRLPLLSYGILFPLTIVGLFWSLKSRKGSKQKHRRTYKTKKAKDKVNEIVGEYANGNSRENVNEKVFVAAALAVLVIFTVIFFVALRYRIPVIPLMIPFAAFTVAELWRYLRARNWNSLSQGLVLIIIPMAILHLPYKPVRDLVLLSKLQSYNQTSLVLQELGKTPQAIEELRAAIKLAPDNSSLHLNLGNVLHDTGDRADAENEYREAIRLNPSNINAHNNLGLILEQRGDFEEAEKEYLQALAINPNHQMARQNLQKLRLRRSQQLPEPGGN
jgi:hypothetical protein